MRTTDGTRNLDQPASAVPVQVANGGVLVTSTEACLVGLALREMTGAAGATVDVFNGSSNNGLLLASFSCAANGQISASLHAKGVWADNGVFLVVGGQVQGAAHIIQPAPDEKPE